MRVAPTDGDGRKTDGVSSVLRLKIVYFAFFCVNDGRPRPWDIFQWGVGRPPKFHLDKWIKTKI